MCCYALWYCQRIFCNAPDLDLQCWWKTKNININILIAKGGLEPLQPPPLAAPLRVGSLKWKKWTKLIRTMRYTSSCNMWCCTKWDKFQVFRKNIIQVAYTKGVAVKIVADVRMAKIDRISSRDVAENLQLLIKPRDKIRPAWCLSGFLN